MTPEDAARRRRWEMLPLDTRYECLQEAVIENPHSVMLEALAIAFAYRIRARLWGLWTGIIMAAWLAREVIW